MYRGITNFNANGRAIVSLPNSKESVKFSQEINEEDVIDKE
ncbi:hypothetical protein Q4509_06195 [Oceanihabitans sp. 1_MG-2023]|nr:MULTISPECIES: hypothetical protein [Flavobacteriaceae]MDO6622441.1 hypothetical protein [Oceanihabitans sp. 1_MG-2023]